MRGEASAYDLRDKDVIRTLDGMATDGITVYLGVKPMMYRAYVDGAGYWRPGDGRPALADDDPAVMQAIARCAAARTRWGDGISVGAVHPEPCGWCPYPIGELLRACDWAVWSAQVVASEYLSWSGRDGSAYARGTPRMEAAAKAHADVFGKPAHAEFWALPSDRREARIRAAIEASRS